MILSSKLISEASKALHAHYGIDVDNIEIQPTSKNFEGDITIVIFPLLKLIKGNPLEISKVVGDYLVSHCPEVESYGLIKGFLNLTISDTYYLNFVRAVASSESGLPPKKDIRKSSVIVEYSSPNTNKPLHLGHIRNNLLGYSISKILEAQGNKVYKTQIINDRGIHICKSMLAWKMFGGGETPDSSGLKGDKFVGKYYILFDKYYKEEVKTLISKGQEEQSAKREAPMLLAAQEMLKDWERGDTQVRTLWQKMNDWVYRGFEITYKNLGVDFDCNYYESETYLLGKKVIEEGLKKGIFYKKTDHSIWVDLTDEGLDEKLLLRSDGTAVYMTQDIGTAIKRFEDISDANAMIYTVGNEQDYHFKVLFLILKKMGYPWSESLSHLSYGMVDLPEGKMKSREGTVVDADDLMDDMDFRAKTISEELGKLDGYTDTEKQKLYHDIGLGALKYYLLKVDPKKRILFDPKESIDFNGNTGPFIQYAHARIKSILRRSDKKDLLTKNFKLDKIDQKEKALIKQIELFSEKLSLAAENLNPAEISNYTYDLVKTFNSFYQNLSILEAESPDNKFFRLNICHIVARLISFNLSLLGIEAPDRM